MGTAWLALLCLLLVAWYPLNFAAELLKTLPSIGLRGPIAAIELLGHGLVVALCVAAGLSLWNGHPHGLGFARVALVLVALAAVQSLYWSLLPNATMPGDELPLALFAIMHSALWLLYLHRTRGGLVSRVRDSRTLSVIFVVGSVAGGDVQQLPQIRSSRLAGQAPRSGKPVTECRARDTIKKLSHEPDARSTVRASLASEPVGESEG